MKPRTRSKPEDTEIAERMLKLLNDSSYLKDLVQSNKRLKRKYMSTDVFKLNFPTLYENYIRELTIGDLYKLDFCYVMQFNTLNYIEI